ncbi:hypothetical protein FH608_045875 [Nonomuraea phyllanthi]|uniref:Uncharacterized protein n=1 Tax=Nonomuraea phyllanthi TaxID=2219224 RepID=A0A5C4V660_9ACTN|nr:hypothetical protein [Nonomuraea phyllanthi]KAB8186826.1 hypothetical protein FH608_045875 [Nonomuraea phyllanthi]
MVCLGAWELGEVTVEVCVTRVDQGPPVVRIARHYAGGPRLESDLDTGLAAELADILDLLTRGFYREFGAVLKEAAAGAAAEASREDTAAP